MTYDMNGGGQRQCAWCSAWFTPVPSFYRCCCDDHYHLWKAAERDEWVQQGKAIAQREGGEASQAALDAARVEGYQRGYEEGYEEGGRQGYEEARSKAVAALEELLKYWRHGALSDGVTPHPLLDSQL